MGKLKVILFDLDNTLWDHQLAQEVAINKLAKKYNLPAYDFNLLFAFFNEQAWKMFCRKELSLSEMRHYRFALTLEAMGEIASGLDPLSLGNEYLEVYAQEGFLRPKAEIVVKELAQRYKIGIVTNGFYETQLKKVNLSPLAPYISYFVSAEEAGYLKPAEGFFNFVVKKCGANLDEIILVGDSYEEDIIGGKEVGLKVIWYNPNYTEIPQPHPKFLPDYVISELVELPELIEKICK